MSQPDSGTRLLHWHDIIVAAVLLTRLPWPHLPAAAFVQSARATWAYPLVGLVIGALSLVTWHGLSWLGLPSTLTAALTLLCLCLLTGALHEDGLADCADGFWGGHNPTDRLAIMKDSRIGAYGVLALVFISVLRWQALVIAGPIALLVTASLSRGVLPGVMHLGTFARDSGLATSVGRPLRGSALLALGIGGGVTILGLGLSAGLVCLGLALGVATLYMRLADRKVGGITGDVLGAIQIVTETTLLVVLAGLASQ